MDEPPYESIIIIVAFWVLIIVVIIMVVCRLKYMKKLHENIRAPNEPVEPRRIIQIYYIENADGIQELSGHSSSILNKILPRLEDQHPPSYEEATVTSFSEMNTNGSEGLDREQPSTSSASREVGVGGATNHHPNINNTVGRLRPDQNEGQNDLVIVVDRTLPSS